jgi:hypothetical protein
MRRTARWLTLGAVVVIAVIAILRASAPTASAALTFLHLNCPPGSHGAARSDGVGRNLLDARHQARSHRP